MSDDCYEDYLDGSLFSKGIHREKKKLRKERAAHDMGYIDNLSFHDKKAKLKKKIVKKVNHTRSLQSFEGRSSRKKKKRFKPLSLLYDVAIPKARPSKKLLADSSVSDSGFVKRNRQFVREFGKGTDGNSVPLALDLYFSTVGEDKDVGLISELLYDLSVEDEAVMALDYGRRLGLAPIYDEESALQGLRETISR